MQIIIYGDLHGCFDEFIALRAKINPSDEDREILIGDIVDRGSKSNELFTYVRENGIESIMGNHEYKYYRYKKHNDKLKESGKKNPMQFTDDKLKIFNNFSDADLEFLQTLPFFIKIDNLTLVHAGLLNKIDLETATKKELEYLLWIRYLDKDGKPLSLGMEDENSNYWTDIYNGEEGIIIYGHEPFNQVRIDKFSIGIDTGCVYGNRLSACIFKDTKNPMNNYEIVDIELANQILEK